MVQPADLPRSCLRLAFQAQSLRDLSAWSYALFSAMAVYLLECGMAAAAATPPSNARSPLGINLEFVSYRSSQQPFLDIFKTNSGFVTQDAAGQDTHEEKFLNLDADGWPVTLAAAGESTAQRFTQLSVRLLQGLPDTANGVYRSGKYVVRYEGEGTVLYALDARKIYQLSKPGRDVIEVPNATRDGIQIVIASTDPRHIGNYLRKIQLVKAEQEQALDSGQRFAPHFLNEIRRFRALRFMDWFATNGSEQSSWSRRALPSNASWALRAGVPLEIAVQLANEISADAWLNLPLGADDDFVRRFASLVHQRLGARQRAYVELSNEVWNRDFPQFAYAAQQGRAAWRLRSESEAVNNWYGMRSAQVCDIWRSVWGADASRVVCVIAAQAANPQVAIQSLLCPQWSGAPCVRHGIGALAIAPYFGDAVPAAWTSHADGGVGALFASMVSRNDAAIPEGGWLGQAIEWVSRYAAISARYKIALIAYEGGQSFSDPRHDESSALNRMYLAANRDSRMVATYQAYLRGWKQAGGQLFVAYEDVSSYGRYGSWGALESFMQTTNPLQAAPPKWQALQNFISDNPCWWSDCTELPH